MSRAVRYRGGQVCAHILQDRCAHDRCRAGIAPEWPSVLLCDRCRRRVDEFIRESSQFGAVQLAYRRTSDGGYAFEWQDGQGGAA